MPTAVFQKGVSENKGSSENTGKLTLVLMAGLPGVGKTKLAFDLQKALQDKSRWQVIDKDTYIMNILHIMDSLRIRGILHKMKLKGRCLDEDLAARVAYIQALHEVRTVIVKQHSSVILDSAALRPFILEKAIKVVNTVPASRLKVIHCTANHTLRVARMLNRPGPHPKAWVNPEDDVSEPELFEHLPANSLTLDMSKPFEENLEKAKTYVLSEVW